MGRSASWGVKACGGVLAVGDEGLYGVGISGSVLLVGLSALLGLFRLRSSGDDLVVLQLAWLVLACLLAGRVESRPLLSCSC